MIRGERLINQSSKKDEGIKIYKRGKNTKFKFELRKITGKYQKMCKEER